MTVEHGTRSSMVSARQYDEYLEVFRTEQEAEAYYQDAILSSKY